MKHVITLPYPISANRYWRQFYNPKTKHVMQGPSSDAKKFKRDCALLVRAAGIREPIVGRVSVHLQLYPALPQDHAKRKRLDPLRWDETVRCIDLDNARKVVYDALKGLAFEDDAMIFRDSGERMEPDGDARCVVTIEPIVRASPQPALDLVDVTMSIRRGPLLPLTRNEEQLS